MLSDPVPGSDPLSEGSRGLGREGKVEDNGRTGRDGKNQVR